MRLEAAAAQPLPAEDAPAALGEDAAGLVSTPYGLGHVASERDDGVFVVKLAWATLYANGAALSSPPEAEAGAEAATA